MSKLNSSIEAVLRSYKERRIRNVKEHEAIATAMIVFNYHYPNVSTAETTHTVRQLITADKLAQRNLYESKTFD